MTLSEAGPCNGRASMLVGSDDLVALYDNVAVGRTASPSYQRARTDVGPFTPAQGVSEDGLTDVDWAEGKMPPASRHTN